MISEPIRIDDYSYIKGLHEMTDGIKHLGVSSKMLVVDGFAYLIKNGMQFPWNEGKIVNADPNFLLRLKDQQLRVCCNVGSRSLSIFDQRD